MCVRERESYLFVTVVGVFSESQPLAVHQTCLAQVQRGATGHDAAAGEDLL